MTKMKLLAATSLGSLFITAVEAFGPAKRACRPILLSSSATLPQRQSYSAYTPRGRNEGRTRLQSSYLDNLSGTSSSYSSTSSPSSPSSSSPSATTTITKLNLEIADALANGVIATALRNNFAPVVVTVVDKSANALVQKRMDGDVHAAFPEFSYAKAYTCVTMNVSSREFRDKYATKENDPAKMAQVTSMMAITGKMAAFPGGVLLRNDEGTPIGAIGVSGAAGDEDEYMALTSVWESGLALRTQPAEHSCATALDG
mmetsp:Transcript_5450/g.11837  ORF Transcript_5450/g.11837 Transcript_5450/m.11837 type:complete len:258 (+) Transcript_5450:92-865(+)